MSYLDMALETEEYITAEEYLRRRKEGKIDTTKVRYALDNQNGRIGGFYVKLDQPRYKIAIPAVNKGSRNGR